MTPPAQHPAPCELNARRPVSIRELFTIGIGPSSSHTVGPMRAAARFMAALPAGRTPASLAVRLYGSLALTGLGHHTDRAVILGLAGFEPETVDPELASRFLDEVRRERRLPTARHGTVPLDWDADVVFVRRFVREHPNTLDVSATFSDGSVAEARFQSIGGGAILEVGASTAPTNLVLPLPFSSGAELLEICRLHGCSIADVVRRNETAWRSAEETDQFVDDVCAAMMACIDRGTAASGILPGGLGVRRRAGALLSDLNNRCDPGAPSSVFEWVSLWALAVNEENAAGGRVVTAPTNGAAGVLPAVLRYYLRYVPGADAAGARDFLYTAAAIGFLYKKRASISAAEMGCQGEVGVACSMAAAALAAVLGATPRQVENAAEIGMEHNLGLTCDPIGGLVQIPCIERNTMGAVKAINAALLALRGDGQHVVSLDQVIETMRQTGLDMRSRYKETSLGGLAVNVVEC